MNSVMLNRGEIRIADLETGHSFECEFGKIRPVILVGDGNDGAIIVPMTTKARSELSNTRILIPQTPANGLTQDGVAVAHHIRSIDVRRIGRRIGQVESALLDQVIVAVAIAIGLSI